MVLSMVLHLHAHQLIAAFDIVSDMDIYWNPSIHHDQYALPPSGIFMSSFMDIRGIEGLAARFPTRSFNVLFTYHERAFQMVLNI